MGNRDLLFTESQPFGGLTSSFSFGFRELTFFCGGMVKEGSVMDGCVDLCPSPRYRQ